jgi:predicted DNA-binding ribbon-helix-helix protein
MFPADRVFYATLEARRLLMLLPLAGGRGSMKKSLVVKRSVVINGHKTSISLEDVFWTALKEIAHERNETLQHLITSIDANRQSVNLSSVLRVFVLRHYMDQHRRRISIVPDA